MNNIIQAKKISKNYNFLKKSFSILNKVSLSISKGETLAVIGPSGIGKSTLLQILGTLDRPDSGNLFYEDKDVFSLKDQEISNFRNQKIGFVFQFHHLLNNFSALENAMLPALIGKINKKKAQYRAEKLLISVGLKEKIKYRPNQLSGGERQRVAIARSLIQNPLILIADEPTGNLDKKNAINIQKLLLQLNKKIGMALIIATHNKSLAKSMTKQITILNGELVKNKF